MSTARRSSTGSSGGGWTSLPPTPSSSSRRRAPGARSNSARPSRRPRPAQPGQYLIVSDIEAARNELRRRRRRGQRDLPRRPGLGRAYWSSGRVTGSRASQLLLLAIVQRPRRQQLAAAGDHDAAARSGRRGATSFSSASDLASALRRAEAAHGEHEKRTRAALTRTGPTGTRSTWCGADR